ncbi:MAG: hypothetical protein GY953_15580, partial [bacterium]|nr:hypothetical protein [bacterium]
MEFTNWDTLLYGIHRGECILFLGPDLPLHAPGADRLIPARALADRLLSTLDAQDGAPSNLDSNNLARIAQRFLAQKGEIALEREVTLWHQDLKSSHSAVHEALAVLPFHWIITTSHDPLIDNALRREGKTPAVDRYHYEGAKEELLPDPASGAPVLFHLYGHVDDPRSLVVTEMQLLDLLAAIISKNPPLPNNLNAAL